MTTEEKAKKYDEALEWMRELYPGLHGATKEDAEHYFPELIESKDKRIIEQIKFAVMQMSSDREDTKKECLAWLEKQKEQKPAEYLSKEKVFAIMNKLTSLSFCVPLGSDEEKKIHEITCDVSSLLDYPIEQKPAEWSEEDEKMRKSIVQVLKSFVSQANCESNPSLSASYPTYYKEIDWLKYLQPQAKQEQKPEAKLTGWVARDKEFDSYLGLGLIFFDEKPRRSFDTWSGEIVSQLPWRLFPDLKWEDEPVEVEVTITKK